MGRKTSPALIVPPLVVRPGCHSYRKVNEVGMNYIKKGEKNKNTALHRREFPGSAEAPYRNNHWRTLQNTEKQFVNNDSCTVLAIKVCFVPDLHFNLKQCTQPTRRRSKTTATLHTHQSTSNPDLRGQHTPSGIQHVVLVVHKHEIDGASLLIHNSNSRTLLASSWLVACQRDNPTPHTLM